MERPLNPFVFVFAALIALVVILGASIMLPHDRYYRFQAHNNVSTRKADWIYERLHFDPAPVDVALIGTSRMAGGLSGPDIERLYCKATGHRIRVANLAIPTTGRNMHYIIASEAARMKAPALTVVELNDVETRKPHPGFIFLADAKDVLTAPIAVNLNYLSDLARLPGRQATLFLETILGEPALRKTFDPTLYAGPHLDLTDIQISIDGRIKSRDVAHSRTEMNALRAERMAGVSPLYLSPKPLHRLEYRFARYYLKRIEKLALPYGGETAYAYLPAYGAPEISPALLEALDIADPIFDLGGAPALDPSLWLDATHFNADGAELASKRFAASLAARYPRLGHAAPCN